MCLYVTYYNTISMSVLANSLKLHDTQRSYIKCDENIHYVNTTAMPFKISMFEYISIPYSRIYYEHSYYLGTKHRV